ncbi:hypothetical protein [Alteromonas sp. 009811495]|uniref:hypothetical protein n=1 Tax=Alteromonas sp. 009811495 TaxID=3002962 RepID=UPI00237DC9FD|nr:hypothetical protein [Alteromonas sp. 009811495]WDT86644.1 hypothetical protein OZ660_02535 [Alteromonas sp. 009811495]
MNKDAHLKFLADVRCDVSQHMKWRRRLFDNPDNTKFEVSPESIEDLFPTLAECIRSEGLRFMVEKEDGDSVNAVVFKFYPTLYPEYVKVSFNNPEAR